MVLPQRSSLSEFDSGARYVELAGVRRSEPTVARKRRHFSSCVCDVGWNSAVVDSVHDKTELVTNPISDE